MKSSSLFPLVLLALGTLAPWTVEGARNASKAGACPPRRLAQCFRYEKAECQSDWQCQGEKKCCRDTCGIKCLDPIAISKPVEKKPGNCPVPPGQCLMLDPPNHCETDGQCQGHLKCCTGMCGKACISPVKGKEGLGQTDLPASGLSVPTLWIEQEAHTSRGLLIPTPSGASA
uniref:Secretory leukocyte peptidase inhibitor n=1 Tax=Equus caballus TaxID=9796 RepID=A0A3Q2HSY2_HORSE